ncbi:MAG: glycosyltransferase [Muribaculaceae bacterium]|nr:glycosyltransferase [Muribaculaceae bacterium]
MKKKALFLSHIPPFPKIGGDRIRIAQSLCLLADICDVDVAYISHDKRSQPIKDYEPRIGEEHVFFAAPLTRYLRAMLTLFNRKPEAVNHFNDRHLRRFVESRAGSYDFVFCASPVMAQYAGCFKKKVLDMTDSLTMNYNTLGETSASALKRLFYRADARRMERYESLCAQTFDSVAYISEADRSYLPGGNKCLLGNMVVLPAEESGLPPHKNRQGLVFVGKMDYAPNITAVDFFARKVMPKLRERDPDCRFTIVGASPVEDVKLLADLAGVEVSGFVPSVRPYYHNAALVVAPMLSGSGIQNKILEAMAYGCCVVTTPKGLEGIEELEEALVVLTPDPDAWAQTVANLLADPAQRERIGERARRMVSAKFGKESIRKQFSEFLRPVM